MPSSTPNLGLPYASLAAEADIEQAVNPLADAIDTKLIHVGDLKATVRSTAPSGWLLCDGTSYLRTTYPTLFAALGGTSSPWGLPDGTHFNVPDLRGRVPVGADGTAGRLSANDALGQSGGAEKVTLVAAESGVNGNGVTLGESLEHTHTFNGGASVGVPQGSFYGVVSYVNGNQTSVESVHHIHALQARNADSAHNNMPPYAIVNWLIKT